MTKRKTKPQSKKKRKTKSQSKNWSEQTATAGRIARIIVDLLDYDVAMSQDELEAVDDAMADAFEFTDAERDEFVATASINQVATSAMTTRRINERNGSGNRSTLGGNHDETAK